jgi:hypothetical protein
MDTRTSLKKPSENSQITALASLPRDEMNSRSNCGKIGNSTVEQKCSIILAKLLELLANVLLNF